MERRFCKRGKREPRLNTCSARFSTDATILRSLEILHKRTSRSSVMTKQHARLSRKKQVVSIRALCSSCLAWQIRSPCRANSTLRKNSCTNSRRVFPDRHWCGSTSGMCSATGSTAIKPSKVSAMQLRLIPYKSKHATVSLACCNQADAVSRTPEREYRECIRLAPDFLLARCNLASVVMDLGRFEEAATLCRDNIALAPDLALAHSFLGATLSHQGLLLDALASHRTAMRLAPHEAKIAQTLCRHHARRLRSLYARACRGSRVRSRSIRISNSTHQLLAYALLGHGCFADGWREYRYRPWPAIFRAEYPQITLTQTLPADLHGKHICVLREQGARRREFSSCASRRGFTLTQPARVSPTVQAAKNRRVYWRAAQRPVCTLLTR